MHVHQYIYIYIYIYICIIFIHTHMHICKYLTKHSYEGYLLHVQTSALTVAVVGPYHRPTVRPVCMRVHVCMRVRVCMHEMPVRRAEYYVSCHASRHEYARVRVCLWDRQVLVPLILSGLTSTVCSGMAPVRMIASCTVLCHKPGVWLHTCVRFSTYTTYTDTSCKQIWNHARKAAQINQ
jgi:hypothetical protein